MVIELSKYVNKVQYCRPVVLYTISTLPHSSAHWTLQGATGGGGGGWVRLEGTAYGWHDDLGKDPPAQPLFSTMTFHPLSRCDLRECGAGAITPQRPAGGRAITHVFIMHVCVSRHTHSDIEPT